MAEIAFWLLGLITGLILGLVPSMHINNFLPIFIIAFSSLEIGAMEFIIFVSACSVSFLFSSFISSYFLGAVNEDNFIGSLPSHRFLMRGLGMKALKITLSAALLSTLISFILVFLTKEYYALVYDYVRPRVWILLLLVVIYEILSQGRNAVATVVLTGLLGLIVLHYPYEDTSKLMFPLLVGLFALPNIFLSYTQKVRLPEQKTDVSVNLNRKFIFLTFLGSLGGIAAGFLPAVGTAQITIALQTLVKGSAADFLALTGAIVAANEFFSLLALSLVGNPRSGASVAIQSYAGSMNAKQFYAALLSLLASAAFSFILVTRVASAYIRKVQRMNYSKISVFLICFIFLMVLVITGPHGLLVALCSFFIGLYSLLSGVRRSTNMCVLIIPTIMFFTGLIPHALEMLGI